MVEVSHYEECPFCRGFHWHKFQSLESKLVDISSHVSLDERNFKAWGESIADLLVLTGNAMDTFFRDMKDCPNFTFDEDLARIERRELNVKHYREIFEHYYELSKNQVTLQFELGEPIQITPFKDFSESTPDWWSAYNTTKHQFYDKMYDANLENTISCLAGLFILNALHLCNSYYLAFHDVIVSKLSTIVSPYHTFRELARSKIGTTIWGNPYTIITDIFDFTYRVDKAIDVHTPPLMDIDDWLKEKARLDYNPIAK